MKPSSDCHVIEHHGKPSGLPTTTRREPDSGYLFSTVILYPAFVKIGVRGSKSVKISDKI